MYCQPSTCSAAPPPPLHSAWWHVLICVHARFLTGLDAAGHGGGPGGVCVIWGPGQPVSMSSVLYWYGYGLQVVYVEYFACKPLNRYEIC
ncbi:hypothetical protein EON63_21525 [archaeon]|nr:MAG: hypothetical protein EON63_21525 [archaeon]